MAVQPDRRSKNVKAKETIKEVGDAQVIERATEMQFLWARAKYRLPEISKTIKLRCDPRLIPRRFSPPPVSYKGPNRRKSDDVRTLDKPESVDPKKMERRPSLRTAGNEIKKYLNYLQAKPELKPRQKDPLHQWFVDHSGGTLMEK
ncbi:uncharacterized protein GGS25DRAFT_282677 [Hypoxylon fragiforme]|uniref:uncharacterized protein n=1 Tax=Hypoxylon fragiforme TaxID=63214 RepID=UPI0020C6EC48|nr:uncharacterized protein GGS25DRAFT_282677 [Hypoxylon fragiforme]KAI2608570.1 hypothetical protein GGS25DRAFT_282677 [Hypoxylon fragiforme]